MEWAYENCTNWTLGLLVALICVMNYNEYQKLAIAKTIRYKVTVLQIVFLLFAPLFLIIIPLLILYHQLVSLMLSLKHGKRFAGLLKGLDVTFFTSEGAIYHLVFLVEYDASNSEPFYEFARKSLRKTLLTRFTKCPKSFGIVEKFWGYLYLLKDGMSFEDCFKTLPIAPSATGNISLEDVTKLLSDYSDSPMPVYNKGLWEVLIGTQPINHGKIAQNSHRKSYPIVLRGHHALGDAMHVYRSIIAMFADYEENENVANLRLQDMRTCYKGISVWTNKVWQYIKQLRYMLLVPGLAIANSMLLKTGPNLLHGPTLTNKKIMCAFRDETQQCMQAMNRIRRTYPGSSFEDIFSAALSASLSDYYKKQSQPIPDYLVAEIPSGPKTAAIVQGLHKVGELEISCENDISGYVRKIPTDIASGGNRQSVVNALQFLKRERVLLQESSEREVYYWLSKTIVEILPCSVIEIMAKETQYTAVGITNLIGPPNFTVCGKCPVRDIIAFAANRKYAGITLTSFTYNNIWKLSLIIDRAIISNEEDVQTILNGIVKYILMLDSDS